MRTIDEKTKEEISDPDLTVGELRTVVWASPEAYATIDNVEKFALDDSDYETVQMYHVWTNEEIEQREASEEFAANAEAVGSLPDAVAELSGTVSGNATDVQALGDAIAELSELVSNLIEGK